MVKGTDNQRENAKIYAINLSTKTRGKKSSRMAYFFACKSTCKRDVTLIPRNFWEKMDKSKLRKRNLLLEQFDGTVIKVISIFEGRFETKKVLQNDSHHDGSML